MFSKLSRSIFSLFSLAVLLAFASGARANDVRLYGVIKGKSLTQMSAAAPTLSSGNPFQVQLFADLCAKQGLNSATVQFGTNIISLPATNGYGFQAAFADFGTRDTAYPDGTFTMTLNTVSDGTKTGALTVGVASDSGIPDPQVSNWTAAQSINADSDFTLTWIAWNGGTTNDFVQLMIGDGNGNSIFQSPGFAESGHLDGTKTSVMIPKYALMAGQTYANVTLFFARGNLNASSYPGVPGIGAYFRQTSFSISTVDVQSFLVIKAQQFKQIDNTTPPASQGFQFSVNVNSDFGTGSVSSASVVVPGGGTFSGPLSLPSTNDFQYRDGTNLNTSTLLNAAYPNGSYTMTINTVHDGTKSNIPLSLTPDNYPANTPRISNNFSTAPINAGVDYTFTWDPFIGGTVNDYIQFQIKDSSSTNNNSDGVFKTGQPLQSGALNGTATSVTVPAGTLTPGNTNLTLKLIYARFSSTDVATYPGVAGFAAYAKQTKYAARTLDVERYLLAKGQLFNQTNAAGPLVLSNFVFNAGMKTGGTGQVSSATLQLPSAGATLPLDPNNGFGLKGSYADLATLNAAWPDGTYTMTINTVHDGTKTILLPVTGGAYPSTTPRISNFAAAQAINSCTNFTLTWNSLGGTTNDFVSLEISELNSGDTVFKTPQLGQAGILNGTSTSVTIPAETLKPGRTYQATLIFAEGNYDTTSYPGVTGFETYFKATQFKMVANGTLFRPKMRLTGPFSINQFQFNVDGEDNRGYVLDYTTNLLSSGTVWSSISTNYGSFPFTDSNVPDKIRFYRVREGR